MKRIFIFLMQKTANKDFALSKGGKSDFLIENCLAALERKYGSVGHEKIVDYCIAQAYATQRFASLLRHGNVYHFFGEKAVVRFMERPQGVVYYEDEWLKKHRLSRVELVKKFGDETENPLHKFVFPEYEERTKKRALNEEVGFVICLSSTLLWTPFSPTCLLCRWQKRCKEAEKNMYPKLYTRRVLEYETGAEK